MEKIGLPACSGGSIKGVAIGVRQAVGAPEVDTSPGHKLVIWVSLIGPAAQNTQNFQLEQHSPF